MRSFRTLAANQVSFVTKTTLASNPSRTPVLKRLGDATCHVIEETHDVILVLAAIAVTHAVAHLSVGDAADVTRGGRAWTLHLSFSTGTH